MKCLIVIRRRVRELKKKKWRGPLRANGRRDRESNDKGLGHGTAKRPAMMGAHWQPVR